MEQALLFSSLFKEESEKGLQILIDHLSQKKISWDEIGDPVAISRLSARGNLRTLLHMAVLDNRLDLIEIFKDDPLLKARRDQFGLSPIDLARLLGHKEAALLLESPMDSTKSLEIPKGFSFRANQYLSHPIFETKACFEEVITTVSKAKEDDVIPSEKIWMGIYFDQEIRKGVHSPVEIKHIDSEIGYGVFAKKKIAPCTFVGEYTGIIQQRNPEELKEKNYVLRYTVWQGKKNYCIDAEHFGNFTRFINHSVNPNLKVQSVYWRGIPRMVFFALKEIEEGSQLTFDYGPIFWKTNGQTPKEFS